MFFYDVPNTVPEKKINGDIIKYEVYYMCYFVGSLLVLEHVTVVDAAAERGVFCVGGRGKGGSYYRACYINECNMV